MLVAACLVGCGLGGCGLGEGPIPGLEPVADGGVDPLKPGKPQVLSAPILDAVSQTVTCAEDVAITGRAVPGQTIVGTTPRGAWVTTSNPQTGHFCVAVGLAAGQNAIAVYVQGDQAQSPPAKQSITRQPGCGAQPATSPIGLPIVRASGSVSAAGSASVPARVVRVVSEDKPTMALPPQSGSPEAMVDGNVATFARYQTETAWSWSLSPVKDLPVLVHLALDKPYQVSSIVVVWKEARASSGKTYASDYQVAVASGATPGELPTSPVSSTDPQGWQFVASKLAGAGGEETIDLAGAKLPTARALVLRLVEDGDSFTWNETFEIAEIRVNVADVATARAPDSGVPVTLLPTASGLCSQAGY
ncbi:MAG: hypothetical protein IPG96_19115 [Proteobacteria bacterium]|nr:hypothetical protein [Pseudomonadota bacterium]